MSKVAGEICSEAADLVSGDRAAAYGDAKANYEVVAGLWSAFLGVPISAQQAAIMMALLKIGRIATGSNKRDNFVDLAGYAGVAGEIAE